jgi:hypothetical protein
LRIAFAFEFSRDLDCVDFSWRDFDRVSVSFFAGDTFAVVLRFVELAQREVCLRFGVVFRFRIAFVIGFLLLFAPLGHPRAAGDGRFPKARSRVERRAIFGQRLPGPEHKMLRTMD